MMKDPTKKPRRFGFLDGVRGLTASYIVFNHATLNIVLHDKAHAMSAGVRSIAGLLKNGLLAVQIFIVLSGFCLMLAAMGDGGRLRGGLQGFAVRRAARILPCYYGTLVFALCMIALVPGITALDASNRVTIPGLLAHLVMLHNFSPAWILQIDPPMWSLCIEWQIYFIFALILLPIWQRLGTVAALLTGIGIGVGIHVVTKGFADYSQPFYIGFFAMGMAGAAISVGTSEFSNRARKLPWTAIGVVFLIACGLIFRFDRSAHAWIISTNFLSLSVAALLTAQMSARPDGFNLRRLLEWKPVDALGRISYSLYLAHYPVLAVLYSMIHRWRLSPDAELGIMLAVGVPASLAVASVFYKFFEKPFLGGFGVLRARVRVQEIVPVAVAD